MCAKSSSSQETEIVSPPDGLQDSGLLTPENSKKIWNYIQEAGDKLVGKLPESHRHPSGRNPYAHVAICVKHKFGQSYKDLPDEQMDEVMEYIDNLVENPS